MSLYQYRVPASSIWCVLKSYVTLSRVLTIQIVVLSTAVVIGQHESTTVQNSMMVVDEIHNVGLDLEQLLSLPIRREEPHGRALIFHDEGFIRHYLEPRPRVLMLLFCAYHRTQSSQYVWLLHQDTTRATTVQPGMADVRPKQTPFEMRSPASKDHEVTHHILLVYDSFAPVLKRTRGVLPRRRNGLAPIITLKTRNV